MTGRNAYEGKDFWKNYMVRWWGEDLVQKAGVIQEDWVASAGEDIHLEVYDTGRKAPTVVFLHGLVGHCRMMLPFIVPLYERGYNVVAVDLMGYGRSGRLKGHFTWNQWLANVRDAVEYARKRFGSPVVVSGASMGGPVAFSAAMRYRNVDGVMCYCVWDLQRPEFIKAVIRFGRWSYVVLQFLKALAFLAPRVRFRNSVLINYDNLTDDMELNRTLEHEDPTASTLISLGAAVSMIAQSKWEMPVEAFAIPTLIFQPTDDRMTPPTFARSVYDALKCRKRWVDFVGSSHMTSKPHYFRDVWGPEADRWLKETFSAKGGAAEVA